MTDGKTELSPTQLILQYRTSLHGYIYSCVRNHSDAEDIFQEVSMAIVESIDRLRDQDGFLPWAREIAFRRVLAHVRKNRRERAVDPQIIGALAEAGDRMEQRQPANRRQVALLECLEKLSPRSRQLVVLRYDGAVKRGEQLAARMGLTVQAVYSKLKRIKLSLRECVERRLAAEAE